MRLIGVVFLILFFSFDAIASENPFCTSPISPTNSAQKLSAAINECDNYTMKKASISDVALSCGLAGIGVAAATTAAATLITTPIGIVAAGFVMASAFEMDAQCFSNLNYKRYLVNEFNINLENYYFANCRDPQALHCQDLGKLKINDFNCEPGADPWNDSNDMNSCSEKAVGAQALAQRSCSDLRNLITTKQKSLNAYWGKHNRSETFTIWQDLNRKPPTQFYLESIGVKYQCADLQTKTALLCDAVSILGAGVNIAKPAAKAAVDRVLRYRSPTAMNSAQIGQSIRELAEKNLTKPSMASDPMRMPGGTRERVSRNKSDLEMEEIRLQDDVAVRFSQSGYDTVRLKNSGAGKHPDLSIEGKIFDVYAPQSTTGVQSIALTAIKKANKQQTERVVVHLQRSSVTPAEIRAELTARESVRPSRLQEVLVITPGNEIIRVFP